MENLSKKSLLEFNTYTLEVVRKLYGLDKPGAMSEAVDKLEEWVKKQQHFTKKDFGRDYLERTIITTKGSVERAKERLDKICTLRTLMPQFFGDYDPWKDFKNLHGIAYHAACPKLTKDNHRVVILKYDAQQIDSSMLLNAYRLYSIFGDYTLKHDYMHGFKFIIDYRNINLMELATKMNPVDLGQIMTLLTKGYGARINSIHIISSSKMIDVIVNIFKQVLSAKVGGRIHVHKTTESLNDYITPKEILPMEYGGKEKSLAELNVKYLDVFSSEEFKEYRREMNRARTDESLRRTDTFNEQYMGMPGTFRTLSVD